MSKKNPNAVNDVFLQAVISLSVAEKHHKCFKLEETKDV